MTRGWCRLVALLALGFALTVTATADAPVNTAPRSERYVALGDSYTAGPLIPNQLLDPTGCRRSDANYPHRVQSARGFSLTDVSCSGATTADMSEAQQVSDGSNPPQLDALGPSTTIVTIGISGNDIDFSDIIEGCATILPFANPCKDHYVTNGADTISQRIDATAPKVASVLAAIKARAPRAAIFVVGYPAILPDTGRGCWPSMPIAFDDVAYLRAKTKQLNAMLATQATAAHVHYVDTYDASKAHNACASPSDRWVEPILPANPAAPVHPNARGMQAVANAVVAQMTAAGI